MGLSEKGNAISASRIPRYAIYPWSFGPIRAPWASSDSQSQAQSPFIRRIPGDCHSSHESWPTRFCCPISRESAPRPDSVSWQPLHSVVVQNLPTCCSNPLGIPGNYAQEACIKDA